MTALVAFGLGTRVVVGGLLLFGGSAKLSAGNAFRVSWLRSFVALPSMWLSAVAITFSLMEVAVGAAFVVGVGGGVSAWAAASLLAAVNIVGAATLLRGKQPSCGCAGSFSKSPISWRLVARNTVFITAAGLLAITRSVEPAVASLPAAMAAGAWLATALGGIAAVHWFAIAQSSPMHAAQQTAPTSN